MSNRVDSSDRSDPDPKPMTIKLMINGSDHNGDGDESDGIPLEAGESSLEEQNNSSQLQSYDQ